MVRICLKINFEDQVTLGITGLGFLFTIYQLPHYSANWQRISYSPNFQSQIPKTVGQILYVNFIQILVENQLNNGMVSKHKKEEM